MRILGLDPGTASFGYGVVEKVTTTRPVTYRSVTYGCISTSAKIAMADRLVQIYDQITELINEWKPDAVAIEKLYFMRNITTGIAVSQARGVALLAVAQQGLPLTEYDPTTVKLTITGYGHAEKQQVQKMIQLQLGLKSIPKPDDAADGLAIALCRLLTIH
jgi:crossover junction endodeoxyribonuclease RuvC